MTTMAGDLPGYEEASRALYAHDQKRLAALIRRWPADVRAHVKRLVAASVCGAPGADGGAAQKM
jgi:hypothetical protein